MAKTTFINGNPSQGIQGTRVTAEILNAINNHRHTGLDQDGHGALDYSVATGSANAYAITLPLPLTAHVQGMPIAFKANFTNTGPVTLNVNSLGAVSIIALNQPLSADMILSGSIVQVIYDGNNYQLASPFGNLITLADIAADTTTGNATTGHHGLLPKLSGVVTEFLSGSGTFAALSLSYKIGQLTLNSSGTTIVTGVGFNPALVIFITTAAGGYSIHIGFDDGTTHMGNTLSEANLVGAMSNVYSILAYNSSYVPLLGYISAKGADGFTITRTQNGNATAFVTYLALKV